jgi:serine/threonine protein kinase
LKEEPGEESTPTIRRDGLGASSSAEPTEPTRTLGSPPAHEVRFRTDDVLAGRYKIVRFMAQGGMGEVYEAGDLQLGDRVALKAIRPDIAQDADAMERFRREIQLSRKVTHPNV